MRRTLHHERLEEREARLHRLLSRALDGDAAAYHAFLADLAGSLRAFFRQRMGRRPDDVEDLVQETLIAVHNQRHTYSPSQPLTAWLFAIARYKSIDALRRGARDDARLQPIGEGADELAAPDDDAADARRDLMTLLDTLPDKQRLPIVQVKIEGLSVVECARRTGLSESAVKVGIHRGLKALGRKVGGLP